MSFHIRVDAESVCISLRHQGRASPIRVLRRSHSEVVVTRWRRRQSHDARCQSDSAIAVTRWDRRRPADAGSKCLGCQEDTEHRRDCEQECVLELNRSYFEAKENVDDNGNDDRCVVKTTTGHSTSVFDKLVCILKNSNLIFSSPNSRGAEVMFTSTTRDEKEKGVTWTSKTGKSEKINVLNKATFEISKTEVKEKALRIKLKRDSVDFCREEAAPGDGECRGSQDVRVTNRGMNDVVSASVFSETFKRSTDVDVIVPPEARGASPLPSTTGVPPTPAVQAQHDVYIAHAREDLQVATRLLRVMEERGFSCYMCERDFPVGDCISDVITDAVRASRHVVAVVSKSFLSEDWGMFKLHVSLSRMYETNRAILLPVLVDVCEKDVPSVLRHLSYVDMRSDPNYVDKLISMLQGPEVRVNELLPVGNLSYGIVYNYYLGYLRFVLPGIQQRIDRWCQQHSKKQCFDARMSRKFYILVPVSCYCPQTLVDPGCAISFSGHVDDLELSRAGSLRRVYRHTVWSITKPNGQVLHFVGEYPSCLNTLYQMEMIRNTGLDSNERQRQREEFVARLRDLLASNDHMDSVRVVDYRDKDSFGNIISLSQVLAPVIEEDRLPPSESQ